MTEKKSTSTNCGSAQADLSHKTDLCGSLIKTTLVDFPGRVAAAIFLRGCNLRCPYCYNIELVLPQSAETPANSGLCSLGELFSHLEKRRNVLTGLVVSGGEPLVNPLTPEIIKKAKSLGYKIKLDTNGTLPEKLEQLLNDDALRPDFVAMDIKTAPRRYAETMLGKHEAASQAAASQTQAKPQSPLAASQADALSQAAASQAEEIAQKLERSAKLVAALPPECREWRTVLVPPLVQESDIRDMAEILPKDASWQFAQFRNDSCLDPSYNAIAPYTDAEAARLVETAKELIYGATIR